MFDPAFDELLAPSYPRPPRFSVNGQPLERAPAGGAAEAAWLAVRLPRKRKPAAAGYLWRAPSALAEEERGLAISTLGKVIRRGWDWLGVTPAEPDRIGGLIEAPALAEALTLNKGDFIRQGSRGLAYLSYRKAMQEAVAAQLAAWGDGRAREDSARRRAARPLERDLETVLVDLAAAFPAVAALVERRPGGQRRLPTAEAPHGSGGAALLPAAVPPPEPAAPGEAVPETAPPAAAGEPSPPGAVLAPSAPGRGPRRPARYGLRVQFEDQPESLELGRLVESTVWVNAAHPAYRRAVASRAEGYHLALSVAMALAPLAAEAANTQAFLTAFLAAWGDALGRDARRRTRRHRSRTRA